MMCKINVDSDQSYKKKFVQSIDADTCGPLIVKKNCERACIFASVRNCFKSCYLN